MNPFSPWPFLAAWLVLTTRNAQAAILENPPASTDAGYKAYVAYMKNLGFTDTTIPYWAEVVAGINSLISTNQFDFATDAYNAWSTVVLGVLNKYGLGSLLAGGSYTGDICPPDEQLDIVGRHITTAATVASAS